MRSLAQTLITQAAVAAGLPEAGVMDEPDRQRPAIMPKPRLEIGWLDETLTKASKRLARLPRPATREEDTQAVTRWVVYERKLLVRLTLRTDAAAGLDALSDALLLALPDQVADANGNLVTVKAHKAVRGGFLTRIADPIPERSCAVHVAFAGYLCRDVSAPWIKTVTFNDPIPVQGVLPNG